MANLERFHKAQERDYERALEEIKKGRKESHWMWYIFPQFKGLGYSSTAIYYAIQSKEEAEAYVKDDILFPRLLEISDALLALSSKDPVEVMGIPDNLKLQSSMTLFYIISGKDVFHKVLEKFYDGDLDEKTVRMLKNE